MLVDLPEITYNEISSDVKFIIIMILNNKFEYSSCSIVDIGINNHEYNICPRGEIGRHNGLKIRAFLECQFESGRGHH